MARKKVPHDPAHFYIDSGGGFVENQQSRLMHQSPRNHESGVSFHPKNGVLSLYAYPKGRAL